MANDVAVAGTGVLPRSADSGFERVRAVADAILYEGYLLYPYRRSSAKNRVRWQFGVLAPRPWIEADGPVRPGVTGSTESWYQQTECLLRVEPDAVVRVRVRYLQSQRKGVERRAEGGDYVPVESLEVGGTVHLAFGEAVPRQTDIVVPLAELLAGERAFPTGTPGGEEIEVLADGAARLVRQRCPVEATTVLRAERLREGALCRLRVRTENTGQSIVPGCARDEALLQSLIATHTLIGGSGLEFGSLIDPPEWAEPYVRGCRNLHTFPVLAGGAGCRDLVLSSPIILPDDPEVAPESPWDLQDAAEIDEILTLRTLLLTDDEKREVRATDQRAAEILDRVENMPPEIFARLHGAIRGLRPRQSCAPPGNVSTGVGAGAGAGRATAPWWQEAGEEGVSPSTDSVLVDGVAVAGGSRVRLLPRGRGADAHDMFLVGRTARVAAVFHDVDGSVHIAVTVEDDPAAELHGWYGRFFYFRPDEVQPLDAAVDEERSDGCHRVVEA